MVNISMKPLKSAKYDLEDAKKRQQCLTANSKDSGGGSASGVGSENVANFREESEKHSAVYGVSIQSTTTTTTSAINNNNNNTQQTNNDSYIPNMNTTKSLAVDIIQLTRFKNRRPTFCDERAARKPSFRNMFLGVPEIKRRFSHDIRNLSALSAKRACKDKKKDKHSGGGKSKTKRQKALDGTALSPPHAHNNNNNDDDAGGDLERTKHQNMNTISTIMSVEDSTPDQQASIDNKWLQRPAKRPLVSAGGDEDEDADYPSNSSSTCSSSSSAAAGLSSSSSSLYSPFNDGTNKETKRVLLLQVFVPFLLSGFGNVGAGLFLNFAQTWPVFHESTMFYMLLATVMAFKTNLEATLAARLSTCSNMGTIAGARKKLDAFLGNLSLVHTQSVIFGLMASVFTVTLRSFQAGHLNVTLATQVIATSMLAIVVNEFLSSFVILAMIVISERAGVNPDNVSTLIAAMLGDFTSVLFVSLTANLFNSFDSSLHFVYIIIILSLLCTLPITCYIAAKNSYTANMFWPTHLPLTLAVSVATMSGLVFDHAIRMFTRIAIYQAVVNGVSVNLMAVQASRISTYLQQLNNFAPQKAQQYATVYSPIKALYAKDMNASVARWLILMCVPAISVYLCFIFLVCPKDVDITGYFIMCCFLSIITQVTCVQCLTYIVTPFSWRMQWDPDNVVIPVLMSISDCLGNGILLGAFLFLKHVGDPNSIGPHGQLPHSPVAAAAAAADDYLLQALKQNLTLTMASA